MQDSMTYNETKNYDKNIFKCNDQRRKERTNKSKERRVRVSRKPVYFAVVVMTRRIVSSSHKNSESRFSFGGYREKNWQQGR